MKDRTLLSAAPEGADSITAAASAGALLQGPYHFLVSQAVDKRIEHGGHHPIEEGDEGLHHALMACPSGVFRLGLCVHGEDGSIEDNYHCQVGRAGGEGLPFSFSRRNPQNSCNDEHVRDSNN